MARPKQVRNRIDESDNFVPYAASNMLENLVEAARSIASSDNTHSHVTLAARGGLMHVFPILHDFLNKPFLLSKWLFNFYRFTDARQPFYTAANAFAGSIRRHWSGNIPVDGYILLALEYLTGELGMIIPSCRQELRQDPEITWDEVISFTYSRLFFNPGSTLYLSRDAALRQYWESPRSHYQPCPKLQHFDLSPLCQGWVARI